MSATTSDPGVAAAPSLFRNRNYVWLWAGGAISSLGDYFTFVAMPWLVLSLTHDAAALGLVMALESLPRAAFMLFSGSATDRFSARSVLLASRCGFLLALVALAALLLSGGLRLPHLYGFAVSFGLLSAFALPANRAMLPLVVERTQIQKGNSALMGTQQLIQLFAPVLAGLLIAVGANDAAGAGVRPIAYAFLLNAAAIAVALGLLLQVRVPARSGSSGPPKAGLAEGFRYLRQDVGMRTATLYMGCIGFFAIGPLLTVLPQLAQQRLHDGALSYGLLCAVNGVGSMLGFALGGMLPKPGARQLGLRMLAADIVAGLAILWLGQADRFATAAPALALVGVAASYGGVLALSWVQERVPVALSGRVLGIVMFAVLGLTPVSMALAGLLAAYASLAALLTTSGTAIVAVALLGLLVPGINRFGTQPPPAAYAAA